MFHALYTAASGMTAQQINLDNIANNLANSSTAGFQSRRVQFSDLLYQNDVMPGAAATQQTTVASGLQIGLGTRPGNTEIVQTQGDLSSTGNPLDFAIQGSGFFQILLPNGQTGYTRSGSFQPDAQGNLVTANGDALQPAINITTAATNITVQARQVCKTGASNAHVRLTSPPHSIFVSRDFICLLIAFQYRSTGLLY